MQNYLSEIKILPDERCNKPVLQTHVSTGDSLHDEIMETFYYRDYVSALKNYEDFISRYFHMVPIESTAFKTFLL